jgi:hypothetical protein
MTNWQLAVVVFVLSFLAGFTIAECAYDVTCEEITDE